MRSIPDFPQPSIIQKEKEYFWGNESLAKHIITEFRPIIYNQSDPIFFGKIQGIAFPMLNQKNHAHGTKITVEGLNDKDMTEIFKKEFAAWDELSDEALLKFDKSI